MATKTSEALTLRDRLSRLTHRAACELLGPEGKQLIQQGGTQTIDIDEQVFLGDDLFRLRFFDTRRTVASITLVAGRRQRLNFNCTSCRTMCEHVGAAVALILDEKTALGLAAPPPEDLPRELLNEEQLIQRAIDERRQRAREEKMVVRSQTPDRPWTDYTVTNRESGKSYRISLRGAEPGQSFCACPDFRTNTLGTCKHLIYALEQIRRRFTAAERRRPFRRKELEVYVDYGPELSLRLGVPDKIDPEAESIVRPLVDRPIRDAADLVRRIGRLERLDHRVTVFPDAEEFIQDRLFQERMAKTVAEIRRDPARHPLRKELLKTELLPYQLDGVAFAAGAGRAILADDMGLGKTIQGVGVAELLARETDIRRVLVICPASLKSQWRNEIHRFSDRACQLVVGRTAERAAHYQNDAFFTVCNYEQVIRDLLVIQRVKWDLIILDEGQRIKNWEAKTSNVIKGLRSPFALVLSGTPLENRLDELYSVVQFIDDRRLAPAFRFFHRHRVVDESGKVLGYKNLADLRQRLSPILLRRTRASVMKDLPPRSTEIIRIAPTDEQLTMHAGHMQTVIQITNKKFLTEMDLLRLQKALLMCRMTADSTLLVDKQPPGYSTKLERLGELLEQLLAEEDRKIIVFSEWTTMLGLIEKQLDRLKAGYVRLDGQVPQKKRQALVQRFQTDPACKLFLTSNAGSTGLNLQAANTVVNVDLPWNPAVLEQRIGRAHRMGQQRPVQVYVLVTENTLEEKLLATLSSKHELALAALDADSDVDSVEMVSGMEELKRRLEVLLGAKPDAPVDASQAPASAADITDATSGATAADGETVARRERVAAAGGELLGAAFRFLGELVAAQAPPAVEQQSSLLAVQVRDHLSQCVEQADDGRQRLTVTLPDRAALDVLAQSLARLLAVGQKT